MNASSDRTMQLHHAIDEFEHTVRNGPPGNLITDEVKIRYHQTNVGPLR